MAKQLHHIGIVVKDISHAAEDYKTRMGYSIVSDVVHDPVQTAYVQFLHNKHDSSFIELVSPDGPDSKLANALKKGGGLNHLCQKVEDIEEECSRLVALGMLLLQPPTAASAFPGRRIAWLIGRDGIPLELVEQGIDEWRGLK